MVDRMNRFRPTPAEAGRGRRNIELLLTARRIQSESPGLPWDDAVDMAFAELGYPGTARRLRQDIDGPLDADERSKNR